MAHDRLSGLVNASTWTGAILSGIGAFSLTEWLAIGGFVLALAGFGVNTWYRIATYRLDKRDRQARLKPDLGERP